MERDTEGVTDDVEGVTVVAFECGVQERVVAPARGFPGGGVLLGKLRATFDIREQEGDGARGEFSHRLCPARVLKSAIILPRLAINYILLG